ncbi:GntR family transcriptional regulator [Brevundimonas sp. LM2]|uniref:GntR family transcriptional regulator n=1 Tax=Brevundimonas sp. LM2 TaxID=1938605 RepID=UPI0015599179|nr:GntR family transcriptional regulator [Brevundimonas sp. LM2]
MARNRDPFTQALSSLRDRIQSGALSGGRPVIVQDEAQRLRLSTTPVREALAHLSGEGLVERAASGGYVTLRLDATTARERYAMRGEYIRMALELNRAALGPLRPPAPAFDPAAPGPAVGRLFSMIVCSAGNQVLWSGFERISGQLARLGRLEPFLFDDVEAEALALQEAYVSAAAETFIEATRRFHARRISAAAALAALAFAERDEKTEAQPGRRGTNGFLA